MQPRPAKPESDSVTSPNTLLMTPPATPIKRKERVKASRAAKRTELRAQRRKRKKVLLREKSQLATNASTVTRVAGNIEKQQRVNSLESSAADQPSKVLAADETLPWFVHPDYKNLSFSSVESGQIKGIENVGIHRNESQVSSKGTRCPPAFSLDHDEVIENSDTDTQNMPHNITQTRYSEHYDSKDEHEQALERLTAHMPSAKELWMNGHLTNPDEITSIEANKDHHHNNNIEAVDEIDSLEALSDPETHDIVSQTFSFLIALQHEQCTLLHREQTLTSELHKIQNKVFKLDAQDFAKIARVERERALTMELCHELFIAEYAFRDVLDEKREDREFVLAEGLKELQGKVGILVDEFDAAMEKLKDGKIKAWDT